MNEPSMQSATLATLADQGWSVCARDHRLVFVKGESSVTVPVDGGLRWARDGEEISFDQALRIVPRELHGWLRLAALIGLRHCIAAQMLAVALPPGHARWAALRSRAEPVPAWMDGLARLDGVEVPPVPEGLDDGLGDPPAESPRPSP